MRRPDDRIGVEHARRPMPALIFHAISSPPRLFSYDVVEVDPPGACGDSVCAPNEGVESCPADCAGRELETTFEIVSGIIVDCLSHR